MSDCVCVLVLASRILPQAMLKSRMCDAWHSVGLLVCKEGRGPTNRSPQFSLHGSSSFQVAIKTFDGFGVGSSANAMRSTLVTRAEN